MIPVDQLVLGDPTRGDCLRACIASLLELPAEAVPNFMEGLPVEWCPKAPLAWGQAFRAATNAWLEPRGLAYFEIGFAEALPDWAWEVIPPAGYWIGLGEIVAGSGDLHNVVMRGRGLAHDPSPGRRGLERFVGIGLLVPLDPVYWRKESEK